MTSTSPLDDAKPAPHVISVNVGAVREVEWRGMLVQTAIWKSSVGTAAVAVRGVNLDGDAQADRTVHGGRDKAIYAYASEDYEHWRDVDGVDVEPGLFGENLTVRGLDLRASVVGERWRVGGTLLEVAQPRLPCYKLGIRLNDPRFTKRFLEVARLGAYLRIIEEGELRAGDEIRVVSRPSHGLTLGHMTDVVTGRAETMFAAPELPAHWRRYTSEESGP